MTHPLVLHIWPGRWNLASIDASCLAAVFYLQLNCPENFSVVECTNPDFSPTGQLPFLTHEHRVISPLPLIIKYVSSLNPTTKQDRAATHSNSDAGVAESAKNVAWCAHIESNLGNLVAHVYYAIDDNWSKLTLPTLASMLPIPQRYYIPERLRDVFRPRLEDSGLWPVSRPAEVEKPFKDFNLKGVNKKENYSRIFEREKVLEQARSSFDKYTRLLATGHPLSDRRLTTFDILLAAHLLLLLEPPLPDTSIPSLLADSYPTLVSNARLIQEQVSSSPQAQILPNQGYSWKSLIPWPPSSKRSVNSKTRTDEDIRFERMRWGWVALAASALVIYMTMAVKVVLNTDLLKEDNDFEGEDMGVDVNVEEGEDK